jgi:hypothetical protein
MTSFGQYFFVNDLVLKFIIPTFLLFAYDRKIWLNVKSAEIVNIYSGAYKLCGSSVAKSY